MIRSLFEQQSIAFRISRINHQISRHLSNYWRIIRNHHRSSHNYQSLSIYEDLPPIIFDRIIRNDHRSSLTYVTFPQFLKQPGVLRIHRASDFERLSSRSHREIGKTGRPPVVRYCPQLLSNWHAVCSCSKKGAGETGSLRCGIAKVIRVGTLEWASRGKKHNRWMAMMRFVLNKNWNLF